MGQKLMGVGILLLALLGLGVWKMMASDGSTSGPSTLQSAKEQILGKAVEQVQIQGPIGGEKAGLLENPRVKEILKDKYGLTVVWKKMGSVEMGAADLSAADFAFPSNDFAVDLIKRRNAGRVVKEETVFNSPIVYFTWDTVLAALERGGISKADASGVHYVSPALIEAAKDRKKWSDLGISELFGPVAIATTDPEKSSSGNLFAGLALALGAEGDFADTAKTRAEFDRVAPLFRQGYMEDSSKDIFSQWIRMREAMPIVAGYEAQIIEFARANPEIWKKIAAKARVAYPKPTLWSSHAVVAFTKSGARLIEALSDPEIQRIAWEEHGFRSGFGGDVSAKGVGVQGIAPSVPSVAQMPPADVMESFLSHLESLSSR